MFPQGFSARNVVPAGISSQLPVSPAEGWTTIINGAEMVAVKDKPDDGMLVLNLHIVEGPMAGTEGPYRLNLFSSSEQAAKIAQQQLSALCHVTGKLDAQREEELFNIPFKTIVVPQTGEGKENYTKVKGVLDINGNQPGKSGGVASQQAPAAPPTPPPATSNPFPVVDTPPVVAPTPVQAAAPSATPWSQNPAGEVAAKPAWQK